MLPVGKHGVINERAPLFHGCLPVNKQDKDVKLRITNSNIEVYKQAQVGRVTG